MANYASLKTAIQQVVKTNGNNEITGALLQQSLLAMIDSLGIGYQYLGIATPETNPGTPDQNVFYLASTAGTYTNFGGLVLADGEIAILKYNGAWSKESTGAASLEKVNQLGQEGGKVDNHSLSTIISAPPFNIYSDISSIPVGTEILVRYFIGVERGYSVSICSGESVETRIRTIVPQKQHLIGTYYVSFRKENSNENYIRITNETNAWYRPLSVVIYNNNYGGIHSGWINAEGKSSLMPPDGWACHFVFPVESGQEIKVKGRTLNGCVFAFLASYTPPTQNGESYNMVGERVVVSGNTQEVSAIVPSGANFIWVSVNSASSVGSYYPQYVKIDGYDILGSLLDNLRDNIKTAEELKQKVDPIEVDKLVKGESVVHSWDNYDAAIQDTNGNILAIFSNGHIKTKNFDSSNIVAQNMVIQKAVFMGDSITHGVYSCWHNNEHIETARYNGFDITNLNSVAEATAYHGIHYYFGLIAHCNNVVNLGKRGTGYVADTRNIGNALVVATNYDFSDVDFVALCFGVNDYIQGKEIGDILTKEPGTIIGNMCATIEKILTDNPLCKIVVYSPYNTWGQVSYGGDYTSNTLYGDDETNYALGHTINGNTLQDIINAEDEVCMFYGVQHVKLSKSNVVNRFTIKNIMIDGLHPSKDAYIKLAAEIYGKGNFGD